MTAAVTDEEQMIRVRVAGPLKEAWERVLEERKITQQAAVTSMMAWAVQQDPLVQAMLFGQVPERDHGELAGIVLRRMEGRNPRKGRTK
jgi:hypothetical protein